MVLYYKMQRILLVSVTFILISSLMPCVSNSAGGPQKLSPAVHEALRAVAAGTATPKQKAILYANNDLINKARLARQIPDTQYQAAQNAYAQKNVEFAEIAANKAGADFEVQKSTSKTYQPGTDSDYITKVKSGDQIKQMQTEYNRQINEYLQGHEVTSQPRQDWHNKLDTDFMADASGVSKAEFERIADMNNDAYRRRAAADYEYVSRNPEAGELTQHQTKEYVKEMEDFRNKKQTLIEDMKTKGGIERGSIDEGGLTQKQAQQQKYDSRVGDADARYRADHGLSEPKNPTHQLAKDGAVRQPDVTPEKARDLLGMDPDQKLTDADMQRAQSKWDARRQTAFATEENIRNNATRSTAEGIMENATTKGGDVRRAAADAAEIMENMSPAEKGRFMAEVQDSLPRDPKTGDLTPEGHRTMRELRNQMAQRPGQKPGTKKPGAPDADGPKTGDVEGGPKVDGDGPKAGDVDGSKVAVDADAPKGPKVDADAATGPKVDGDVATGPKVDGDVTAGPKVDADVGTGPKVDADVGTGPKVSGDVATGPKVDADVATGPKVDVDGPKVNVDVDAPKGPKVDVDGPSMGGKALQRAGEVMQAADILNTGQDLVDLYEGKKSAGEVAERAAVNFTPPGQVYSAAAGVDKKTRDLYDAELDADNANRNIETAHATTAAVEAQRKGATKEERDAILHALRNGYPERAEQIAQEIRDRGIDYQIPKAPDKYEVEADDGYWDRTKDVASGIGEQLQRAGQFVWDTAKNVDEIKKTPGSIAEDGATIVINKIRQNQQQSDIYDKFIAQGATPAEAAAAVQGYYDENDLQALKNLREKLQEKKRKEEEKKKNADELAQAMQDNADTPQDIEKWKNGGKSPSDDVTRFVNNFGEANADGVTDAERAQDAEVTVTQDAEKVKKDDIEDVKDAERKKKDDDNQKKTDNQRIDQDAYDSGWQTTMTAVNAALSQLNQADAQKVTQKTQEAIALIQQMQNGTIDDSEFTSKMAALEAEHGNLQKQGQAAWDKIKDQLINGQANNSGSGNTGGAIGSSGDAATDILSSVPPDQIDQRSIVCDTSSKSGNNTPASISVDMKGGTGTATVAYSLYSVKDRLLVQVNGATVSDTGCTNGSASIPVQVNGGDQVRVIVQPACDGSSTSWNFRVSCPKVQYVR